MIGILSIGIGNVRSVYNAVYECGYEPVYIQDSTSIEGLSHIIIPGVGQYRSAMMALREKGIDRALIEHVKKNKPLLGICLGMQILLTTGDEGGLTDGLGIIPGHVSKMKIETDHRLPHVGWNTVHPTQQHPILQEVKPDRDFYFVHSYEGTCNSTDHILATTDYHKKINCAIFNGSAVGLQFHPEKSQRNGLQILENFCEWDGTC